MANIPTSLKGVLQNLSPEINNDCDTRDMVVDI